MLGSVITNMDKKFNPDRDILSKISNNMTSRHRKGTDDDIKWDYSTSDPPRVEYARSLPSTQTRECLSYFYGVSWSNEQSDTHRLSSSADSMTPPSINTGRFINDQIGYKKYKQSPSPEK
jgi:hypothetical protein